MRIPAPVFLFVIPLALLSQEKSPDTVTDASNPFFLKTTVVVTATKSQVDIDKVPAAASVVTSEELQTRGIVLLDQALNTLEGVLVARGKGAADTLAGVGMRGFSGRGTGQSRTLVLLDGEQMNDGYTGVLSWQTLPTSEVDRVEVVRGPFSSLYGGNAMGGVINVVTRPVESRHAEFFGRYGSQDTTTYSANVSDRFWNRLGLTLGYQRLQSGGYLSRLITATASAGSTGIPVTGIAPTMTTAGAPTFVIGDGGNNWSNQNAWRTRGEYTFSTKTTAFFQYIRQAYGYGYDGYHSYLRDASGSAVDNGTFTFTDGGVAKRFSITPKTFISGPGAGINSLYSGRLIHGFTSRQRLQVSGGIFDQGTNWYTTPGSAATLSAGSGVLSARPARSWHTDAQWAWQKSERHDFLFGGEFRHESVTVGEYNLTNYAIKDSVENQTYAAQGKNQTQAAYAQDQIRLTEHFQLVAGGRVDYWQTRDGSNNTFGSTLVNDYPDRSRTSASGKLSGVYQAAGGTTLRASAGTAFRNPTVYNLYRAWQSSSGTLYLSNADLEAEELLSWEAGVRQRAGSRLQFEATYYENRIKNLIYLQTDLSLDPKGKTQIYRNAGRARTRGVELAAQQRPLAWLQLRETYSFTDSVITENPAIPASVGKYVTYVPRHQAAGLLTAQRGRFSGSLTARYVARMYGTDTNTDVTTGVPSAFDPYFELATSFGFQITRNLSFTAGADNLLDRRYFQSYWASGRTAFVGLRVRI
jgi:iron complex outermembrane recepter protein